jgi:hypothetical protein
MNQSKLSFSNRLCDTHLQLLHFFLTLFQLMELQLSLWWEDAWICFKATLVCFSSFRSSTDYLATKHPMDVSSLAGRVMSQPVFIPLQEGVRFFHHLTPYLPQHASRLARPEGEDMGLPLSTYLTANTLGPLYLMVGMSP